MKKRWRSALALGTSILAATTLLMATPGIASAASMDDTSAQSLTGIMTDLSVQHGDSGGGSFESPEGQRVLAALKTDGQNGANMSAMVVPNAVTTGATARNCTGTFNNTSATVTLQESNASIPWGVRLTPGNVSLGEINFSNQSFADNYQANSYQPHFEPWNYRFHGNLGNPFSIYRSTLKHQMHNGSAVSFLWFWHSIARPASGGYTWVNCTYRPGAN